MWRDLYQQVLEEFAEASGAHTLPSVADAAWTAKQRKHDWMRRRRQDPAYREAEYARKRQLWAEAADRKRQACSVVVPVEPERKILPPQSGLRWTDPGNPWMADMVVEVEVD